MTTTASPRSWRSDYDFEDPENFLELSHEEEGISLGGRMSVDVPLHQIRGIAPGFVTLVFIPNEGFVNPEATSSSHSDDVPADAGYDAMEGEEIASADSVRDLFSWSTPSFWMPVAIASIGGGMLGLLSIILAVIANANGSAGFTILFAAVGFLLFVCPGVTVGLILMAVRKHALYTEKPPNMDAA